MHNGGVAKPRILQNAGDMLRSMGVVLGVVAFLLGVTWRPHQQVTYPVDYSGAVAQASKDAPFEVLVPQAPGFAPTVARFEAESYGPPGAVRLYLGFTDAQGRFALVWQSNGRAAAVAGAAGNDGVCDGRFSSEWTRCLSDRPLTRSLVRVADGVTTVVAGTLEWESLQALADSLRPASEVQ